MSANKQRSVTRDAKNTSYDSNRNSCNSSPQCVSPSKPEAKKIPPIKAPVGLARGPDLKNVKSKIGSLQNVKYRPMGGEKKVESQKLSWTAKPRIGSLENARHRPLGGEVKVKTQKLDWKATSKVGSLDNVKHIPGGGAVKIFDEKYAPSPTSTPTPSKSGSLTPTPVDGNENGDTLHTLSNLKISAEKHESIGKVSAISTTSSIATANNSVKSTPINSATSVRTTV